MTAKAHDAPMQKRILEIVKRYPGLHLREIARQADTSEALAGYHLDKIEQRQLVESHTAEGYKRFHAAGLREHPSPQDERLLEALRKPLPVVVVLHLLDVERASNAEMADVAGVSRPAISYHLKSLHRKGILRKGPEGLWLLEDPQRVASILKRWKPTPDIIDRFAKSWASFYRTGRRK